MSLQSLLNDVLKQEAIAARNPADFDPRSRPGIEASIRVAKDSIAEIIARYGKAFLENSIGVFLTGPKAAELAAFAKDLVVTVDAAELYVRVAKEVDPTLGSSRQFTANQASRALTELIVIGTELHVKSMKNVDFGPTVESPTFDTTVAHIRTGVRKALLDDLNRLYVETAAASRAVALRFDGLTAPVLVANALPDEVGGLSAAFGKGATTWIVGDEDQLSEDYLYRMIKEVNRRLKRK